MIVLPIFLMIWLPLVRAGFIKSYSCPNLEYLCLNLAPFLVDVYLDEEHGKLKFFINSQVSSYSDPSSDEVIISDVNATTNRYTTFHAEIKFMGHTIIEENKRFCDMIAVKNDTAFQTGVRARLAESSSSSDSDTYIDSLHDLIAGNSKRDSLADSNSTIESIYSNETGTLVQCPLYNNDSIVIYYEADISTHVNKLGSYTAKFTVISNDESSDTVACNVSYVTPTLPDIIYDVLVIGVAVLLLTSAFINFFTVIYSSYQESYNPFLVTASSICNQKLLQQLDATVETIITYLQFAFFMGGLDVQYPGFYQPLIGRIKWCALLGQSFFSSSDTSDIMKQAREDNVYLTLNTGGLKSLTFYSAELTDNDGWANFMVSLVILLGLMVAALELFIFFRLLVGSLLRTAGHKSLEFGRRFKFLFTFSKNCFYLLGHVIHCFLIVFGLPFLVLTTYMFYLAAEVNGKHQFYPTMTKLNEDAFDLNVSYSDLFSPDQSTTYEHTSTNSSFSYSSHYNMTGHHHSNHTTTLNSKYLAIPKPSLIFGGITYALWYGLAFFFIFKFLISIKGFKVHANKRISKLYTSIKTILSWAKLYHNYHPNRALFVIFDFTSLVLKLVVIGALQSHGLVQVILLTVIELTDLVLLFSLQPFFVPMTWYTTRWVCPVARFLIAILCIAYIRDLLVGEATRTYVAYTQLIIHLLVAVFFIAQLLYCLGMTIVSIVKAKQAKQNEPEQEKAVDDLKNEFEYQPLQPAKQVEQEHNAESFMISNAGVTRSNTVAFRNGDRGEVDDDFYYRGNSSRPMPDVASTLKGSYTKLPSFEDTAYHPEQDRSDTLSYCELQEESDNRRKENDYTFREADLIYRKYFVDASIDPEVKELWDSRMKWKKEKSTQFVNPNSKMPVQQPPSVSKSFSLKVKKALGYKEPQPVERGFQVSRPRALVVKSIAEVQNSPKPKSIDTSSSSDVNSFLNSLRFNT